jgi:hypothetical protein
MSAVAATVQALLAASGVAALVSTRVYPVVAPQATAASHIVVHLIAEDDDMLLRGTAGYPNARVSVECRASTFTAVNALAEAVKSALQPLHLVTYAGVTVSFQKQGSDYSDFADESKTHRRIMDFYARWQ